MRIVKVERDGATAAGFLEGDVVRLAEDWTPTPADETRFGLSALDFGQLRAIASRTLETVPLSSVSLAAPIDPLRRIICVGVNYRDHAGEILADAPANPIVFTRGLETLSPPGAPVIRPKVSESFDFEGEIAVVIGKQARHVAADAAMDHVAGYSCFLDGSVRDYQRQSLTAGKNFWRSGALGPWIVPAQALGVADPTLVTRLNDQVVQSSRASLMIFGIAEIIAYCSRWTLLRPGDVIATGTPGGVGSRRTPPLWMRAGDRIEVEVEGVGRLSNHVIDEA